MSTSTIVFIHGAGCDSSAFAFQREAFDGSIALDLPGHGVPGTPASVAEFADAVSATLAQRSIERAILCGSSMGGAIALEMGLRGDPRVGAIVAIGSGARLRVAPAVIEGLAADFEAAAERLVPFFFAAPTPALLDAAMAAMRRVGQAQALRDFRACDAFDVTERLAEMRVPVLALTGENDAMTPPKYAAFLADRIPGAQARILPGAGHLAMLERPAETNEALRAFVKNIN